MFKNIPKSKFFAIFASVGVFLVIILGFLALGSPAERIAKEFDRARSWALKENVQRIESYARQNQELPSSLSDLDSGRYGYYQGSLRDPETDKYFDYEKKSDTDYSLCATFGAEYQPEEQVLNNPKYGRSLFDIFDVAYDGAPEVRRYIDEEWYYEPGYWCFERSVEGAIRTPSASVPTPYVPEPEGTTLVPALIEVDL